MNHKVQNVQKLYDDSMNLYNKVVRETADSIIDNLKSGISTLKNTWEGKDAGVQIQNVIEVCNAMIVLRNALCQLAQNASGIAANYRSIQNANRANLEVLTPIKYEESAPIENYTDLRDTINISQEAMSGKNKIDAANNSIDGFISSVRRSCDDIMNNWQIGTGREEANEAFGEFLSKSNKYKQTLNSVSSSITDALKNYSM